MIGWGQPKGRCRVGARLRLFTLASVMLAGLMLQGCGPSGDASIGLASTPKPDIPRLQGVVLAPNGELAKVAPSWWPGSLELVARAYAQTNVLPVGPGEIVTLSLVNAVDAADGRIGDTAGYTPLLIAQTFTNPDGSYEILDPAVGHVDACRLMVSVGSGDKLTRAFVFSPQTNIDYMSESVVGVVLDRLTMAPSVQLCDFTNLGLQNISAAVAFATTGANGDTIRAINDDALIRAEASCRVQRAIDQATNVPVQPPDPHCAVTPAAG